MCVITKVLYPEIVVHSSPTSPISFSFVSIKPISVAIYLFRCLYTRWPICHFSPLFSLGFSITLHSIFPSMCTFSSLCPPPFLALSTLSESEDWLFHLRGQPWNTILGWHWLNFLMGFITTKESPYSTKITVD